MSCDQFTDLFELYAIDSLEMPEAEQLRQHLNSGCQNCMTRLNDALLQAALISSTVPLVAPPNSLKQRLLASVSAVPPVLAMPRQRPSSMLPWLVAAALLAALVGTAAWEENARRSEAARLTASNQELQLTSQRTAAMLSILQAPGTKQISFDVDKANLPHGSLFIHKNLGVAMVVAHLPAAPEGWKYESWVVPKSGAPRPVESFATDNTGYAFTVVKGPVDVTQWASMAVSMEPQNSHPVKPTKLVFASPTPNS